MDYKAEYERWLTHTGGDVLEELRRMDEAQIEDAFYRNLAFGTGGLRGVIGAGTNRMNVYVVAKASQGLANTLGEGASVVIGYDSRIKSDVFARTAAAVFAANGITVHFWPELLPVPTVSFAVRRLGASAGVMVTASHNPSKYNGYKVYGPDGCQITTEAAARVLAEINSLDIFRDVKRADFEDALETGRIRYIGEEVLTAFIEEVKAQSVLYGDRIDRDVAIVYSPLNGTGLKPVTRALKESGFTNITVVEEQREPDGHFPTCPYPNPEIREAMALGLQYAARQNADLLLATDPDCDRCGIAVRTANGDYQLLSGNEVGLLLLDYICAQRARHGEMPAHPVFVKTIVTMDLAEKIAAHYDVETVNVLTGLDAAFMICEMFAFYRSRGISLLEKLNELYATYGYCLNTLHSYEFDGSAGMQKMQKIMEYFRRGLEQIGGNRVLRLEDYSKGLNGLPASDVLKFFSEKESVVIRPSGTEPKLKMYISVTAPNREAAEKVEAEIVKELEEGAGTEALN